MSDKRKYRKFTAKQKVELVLASFRGDRSVAEICREHDLSETLLRRWRDQMIEAGAERFSDGVDRSVGLVLVVELLRLSAVGEDNDDRGEGGPRDEDGDEGPGVERQVPRLPRGP